MATQNDQRYGFVIFTGRYEILDYHKADGQQIATADGEDEARTIVRALNASNAYAALVAQREKSLEALRGVRLMLKSELKFYRDEPWARRVNDVLATIESEDQNQ